MEKIFGCFQAISTNLALKATRVISQFLCIIIQMTDFFFCQILTGQDQSLDKAIFFLEALVKKLLPNSFRLLAKCGFSFCVVALWSFVVVVLFCLMEDLMSYRSQQFPTFLTSV